MVLGSLAAWAAGFAWGRSAFRQEILEPRPSERQSENASWMERHQRLRENVGLASRNQHLLSRRQQIDQQTLQLQLSPHFMFNALSSVQWLWTDGKHEAARDTFACFVRLWQRHWTDAPAQMHSLRDEIASLEEYVHLEASRRGLPVQWSVETSSGISWDALVPTLLFQPALENALWHGFAEAPDSPSLCLSIEHTPHTGAEPWVRIRVLDNGVGLSATTEGSTFHSSVSRGNEITSKRLQALHPESFFEIAEAPKPWSTEARFVLPLTPPTSQA